VVQEKSVIEKAEVANILNESDADSDFLDGGNEVDKGDDELFEKFVDTDVQEELAATIVSARAWIRPR
jgi:hypothetical protein